ncbi:hypothetical protein ABIA33_004489 [Streptacidiphilus sp. MAP12-16]|uniref:hypothetical protein n=1 Tax=Streptacidiphilus sp. MAP12-16 TaxID=3156300 RepID=UPI003518542F
MTGGREPFERAGDIGPLETPHELSRESGSGAPATVLSESGGSALERRFGAWWRGLGVRRRRWTLLVTGTVVLVLLGALVAYEHHRVTIAAPPPPWPAQITKVDYSGVGPPPDASGRRFTLLLTFTDSGDHNVTITQIAQSYRGMVVSVQPAMPIVLYPGKPQVVRLAVDVQNCLNAPLHDDLPFIDVTLSNPRAIQTQSEILGDSYTADVDRLLTRACTGFPVKPSAGPRPSVR